jgi:hypothetical protein
MTSKELAEFAPLDTDEAVEFILDWSRPSDPFISKRVSDYAAKVATNVAHAAGPTLRMYWKLQEAEEAAERWHQEAHSIYDGRTCPATYQTCPYKSF